MMNLRRTGVALAALSLLAAATPVSPDTDPVVAVRVQRAAALGIAVDDLPPVPRTVIEPPPLPPPEIHPKDLRGRRGVRKAKTTTATKKGTPVKRKAAAKKSPKKATRAKGK
jgi:hypothetical protein